MPNSAAKLHTFEADDDAAAQIMLPADQRRDCGRDLQQVRAQGSHQSKLAFR